MTINLTAELLIKAFPTIKHDNALMVASSIPKSVTTYSLDTVNRLAAFLAQTAHESAMFTTSTENLNYSADGLKKIFGKYFPTDALAAKYARNPTMIANRVYASRMGNGPESSGDGWKYRGAGWLQITGHDNMAAFAKTLDMNLDDATAYLHTPEGGFMGAGWFWSLHGLNDLADKGDITTISKRINGGTVGLADRISLYNAAQKVLMFA